MPVYFIRSEQVVDGIILVDGPLAHHLKNVLRVRVGEQCRLVDEKPLRYAAEVTAVDGRGIRCRVHRTEAPPPIGAQISLALAVLKGERMDWAIQKATELGVSRISPLVTVRTVARPAKDRLDHQHRRWMNIITEAAQQVGRWTLPSLDLPRSLSDFLIDGHDGFKLLFWEEAPSAAYHDTIRRAVATSPRGGSVVIGPEGGWERSEVEAAKNQGFEIASLGTRIFRAETAVLAALSIVAYETDAGESPSAGHTTSCF